MLGDHGVQPDRQESDGPVSINRGDKEGTLIIEVTTDGNRQEMLVSYYNAWRVFGMLSFMLGIELGKKLGARIKL